MRIPPRVMNRCWCAGALLLGILSIFSGCTRPDYRRRADAAAYTLVDSVAVDPRWRLPGYTIQVNPQSRMYSPYSPDFPPMPPDDPTAHRLMHYVDGKQGFPCWHRNGDTPFVENPLWPTYLPFTDDGQLVLDRNAAVQLALLESPDFQGELEELYLSALDVSFERFRFDSQFFGGNSVFYTADGRVRGGGESSSVLGVTTDAQMRRLFAAGGDLVVGFANSFVWQFAGNDTETVNSLVDFSFIQPLLRGGGRARVLETLTLSERALLANVRQMERFRRGFYLDIVIGRSGTPGPQRRGGIFGGAGLQGFSGVGAGGFGRVGGSGNVGTGAGAGQAGGFIGILQNQRSIQNQVFNVMGLLDSLAQLEASFDAGRIDNFQVDQARQALYNGQSRLLSSRAAYESTLDGFKADLGLPPNTKIVAQDPLLDQFILMDPRLTFLQANVGEFLEELRGANPPDVLDPAAGVLQRVAQLRGASARHLGDLKQDMTRLFENADARREGLRLLDRRPEIARGDIDPRLFDVAVFNERIEVLQRDVETFEARFTETEAQLEGLAPALQRAPPEESAAAMLELMTKLSGQLVELSLLQARARLDAVMLVPVSIDEDTAVEIARVNRLDWMNARASLVDSWRLIEFNANDLLSDLDVTFAGGLANTADNPFGFRDTNGRLTVGIEFDAPLTRVGERNIYRQSLIEYQEARRNYYQFEDAIRSGLRNTIRTIELNQLNLEIRRAAVVIAISQVEQARLRLDEPPLPGATGQLGSTTVRDLVDSLDSLRQVQDEFLSVWVNFELQRMNLDFDLGTMQLDANGLWIDPGPMDYSQEQPENEEIVPPEMLPAPDFDPGPLPRPIPPGGEAELEALGTAVPDAEVFNQKERDAERTSPLELTPDVPQGNLPNGQIP